MKQDMMEQHTNQGEIVMYQPDETIRLEVRLENDTVWLTQAQIVALFQKAKSTISFHISNIFKEGELDEKVVVRKNRTTTIHGAIDGKKQTHEVAYYTEHVGQSLQHLQQLNQQQYRRRVEVKEYNNRFHDRFLILDDALYHFGASFKDLGKRLFAFEQMGIDKEIILNQM